MRFSILATFPPHPVGRWNQKTSRGTVEPDFHPSRGCVLPRKARHWSGQPKYPNSSPPEINAAQLRTKKLPGELRGGRPHLGDEVTDPLHHLEHGAAKRGKPNCETNSVAALSNIARRRSEPLIWFALSSVSGLRLVPSDRPRASSVRLHTLGSGSPISVVSATAAMTDTCRLFAGNNSREPCFGKQKTLRSAGSGGSV